MLNWMFESRSKSYDYDEPEGETYLPLLKWYEILLIPVVAVVLMVLGTLFLLSVFGYGFYEIAHKSYEKGGLEFPRLTVAGILLTVILWIAHSKSGFEFSNHPFITYWSSILVIYFTLAPLTGFAWQLLFKPK